MALAASLLGHGREIVPLTLLTLDAWTCPSAAPARRAAVRAVAARPKWTIYFLMAVGLLGTSWAPRVRFLINPAHSLLLRSGQLLTANHGHGAMFGVFGLLALAVLVSACAACPTRRLETNPASGSN